MKLPKVYANTVKKRPIDMTLSENPLGCSPRAIRATKNISVKDIAEYPDIKPLIQMAAKQFDIPTSCIIAGNGSEQLIKLIAQTFLTKGDVACVESCSFSLFTKDCMLAGATVILLSLKTLIAKKRQPKLLILCNPNNPTGVPIPDATLQQIISLFPKTIIVIDEANAEFSGQTSIPQAIKSNNILMLRTCSKAFGLAGLRIGFCIGNQRLIKKLNVTQQPFPIAATSVKIGIAALSDKKFLRQTMQFIKKERTIMQKALTQRGLGVSNSVTNTLFITTKNANSIIAELDTLGVSVIASTFFPGCTTAGFRIALRDKKTNKLFLEKLDQAIENLSINLLR